MSANVIKLLYKLDGIRLATLDRTGQPTPNEVESRAPSLICPHRAARPTGKKLTIRSLLRYAHQSRGNLYDLAI